MNSLPNEQLFDAIYNRDAEAVNSALNNNPDPNVRNQHDNTALIAAAENRSPLFPGEEGPDPALEVVEVLLNRGADPNLPGQENQTALMAAARNGQTGMVRLLLEKGAKPEAKDIHGKNALIEATRGMHLETMELLLQSDNSDVNKAMQWAIAEGQAPFIQLLLEYGADPNATDEHGSTLLAQISGLGNRTDAAQTLLKHGADPNIANKEGVTPLMVAVEGHFLSVPADFGLEMVTLLLEHGADPKASTRSGHTALHVAHGPHPKIAALLLEAGADPCAANNRGHTPVGEAVWYKFVDTIATAGNPSKGMSGGP